MGHNTNAGVRGYSTVIHTVYARVIRAAIILEAAIILVLMPTISTAIHITAQMRMARGYVMSATTTRRA